MSQERIHVELGSKHQKKNNMGLFNRKKNVSKSKSMDALIDKVDEMFFGGSENKYTQMKELYNLFDHRYNYEQIGNALTWMTMRFFRSDDRSSQGLVDEGQMRRPNNPFSRDDAMKLYNYVVRKAFEKNMPKAPEEMFEPLYKSLGNYETGATTDVIPEAYGEYGLCVTNPVPTRGVSTNEAYLKRLSLLSGEPFHWERIGSFGAPNIENPIDGYEIITDNGEHLCTIYISPYQRIISNKAPKGFYIK